MMAVLAGAEEEAGAADEAARSLERAVRRPMLSRTRRELTLAITLVISMLIA